jgi:transcriptional regulator with XRE-family HTH domain
MEPQKLNRQNELLKFRRIYGQLKEKFNVNQMAKATGIKPGNLSSYASGASDPGEKTLTKFYNAMAEEIEKLPKEEYPHDSGATELSVEEALLDYHQQPTAENSRVVLIKDNTYLRTILNSVTRAHEKHINNDEIVAKTFDKLVDEILSKRNSGDKDNSNK